MRPRRPQKRPQKASKLPQMRPQKTPNLPQEASKDPKSSPKRGVWFGREVGDGVPLWGAMTPCPTETVRTATPFPMVSLFLVFTAFVISNVGHIRPQRTLLAFVCPLVVGLVLYISSINDEVMLNRPGGSEQYFQYRYGWSFAFAASSFLLKEGAGVMSVVPISRKRYAEEERFRSPSVLLVPSQCVFGLSGQFLQPRAWPRPRSPSGNRAYPAAIQYPGQGQGHLTSPRD
uniref:Voltage-dependent calcium channel gamma-7 subunit n=1 Tax=Coturnix japonica TaxID=93934 RepID=A0A8C2SPK8_COTJA